MIQQRRSIVYLLPFRSPPSRPARNGHLIAKQPADSALTHHPASVRTAIRRKNESPGGTIILIHGLWMHAIVWQVQEVRLQRAGYTVRSISYPSWKGTLLANVERLAKVIAGLPATSIHLVGHSLGGLLALALLSRQPDSRIRRVVLLGSPCLDCHSARQLLSWPLVSPLVGRCLEDWLAAPAPNFPADVEVGIIAGTQRFGLGCVIPGLPTPNDGVVALAETLLPAARDVIALPVSHSGMLISKTCCEQVASFLRTGRFQHA